METRKKQGRERRQFSRVHRGMDVKVATGDYREVLQTENVSDGGVMLKMCSRLNWSTNAMVRLTPQDTKGAPTVHGRVAWVSPLGIGVEFIGL